MRLFAWIALCCAATCLRAALPESVLEACLAPSVREQASAKRWQVLSRAEWENRPVLDYAGSARISKEYRALTKEILKRCV